MALSGSLSQIPILELREFRDRILALSREGWRVATYFGSPISGSPDAHLNAFLIQDRSGVLTFLRTRLGRDAHYPSLTPELPELHCFERECYEQYGIRPSGHPWLKPVRRTEAYPFYRLEGKEIHEVGVGPIHAGVIEPGHFRFQCYGETVHHLEIQLGYQHRGAERLLLQRDPGRLAPLVETLSGDSSIAHTWAYCRAYEALCGAQVRPEVELLRGIALELERVAMHLAGLAGMSTDIAFQPGASTYGRLRTAAINTTMRLCGSRFGRGWLRPGEARCDLTPEALDAAERALRALARDIRPVNDLFRGSKTVRHRLQGTGAVSLESALEMGFVGMAARMTGLSRDLRSNVPAEPYSRLPLRTLTEGSGDCWARALLRIREIDASLDWLFTALKTVEHARPPAPRTTGLLAAPGSFALGFVEGWRGEVLHYLETDADGKLSHYRVQDPSLRNWFALALAVRENEISDFPICNKSFDLSYCGQDL